MIYRKNLYSWEQALRLLVGVALIAYPVYAIWGSLLGYLLIATGVVLVATAIFGYCPMCAMFGRTLRTKTSGQ